MEHKIKDRLFISLFAILLLPMLQQYFPVISSGYLSGFYEETTMPDFTWTKWLDGSFRDETGNYLNDHTGFRPDMLRLNNQLEYSLFQRLHAPRLAPGKDKYLFQLPHINAYYGRDFIGYDSILSVMQQYKAVSDTLSKLGKTMVMVHSPCKAFFYPEYIPDDLKSRKRGATNFETYVHMADSLGIKQVNFNSWFVSLKNKSTELLCTRQGIHWSVYGSYIAADSFVNYLEQQRHIRMPHPVWTSIVHTQIARDPDDDLEKTLNLIFPYVAETFSYPDVSYPVDQTMTKPKVIYIGDSFLGTWIEDGLMNNTNTDWQVWIHFNMIRDKDHPFEHADNKLVGNTNWLNAINNTDCVVLMYTSFNMNEFGDGFIQAAYHHYYPGKQ